MITSSIKYGGTLEIGDFLGIGSNWGMSFGWYSGNGKSGNIQYITPNQVVWSFGAYHKRMNNPAVKISSKDRGGFSLEHIEKSPVRIHKNDTMVKITCPDDVFTGADLQKYLEAKKILQQMHFLKR